MFLSFVVSTSGFNNSSLDSFGFKINSVGSKEFNSEFSENFFNISFVNTQFSFSHDGSSIGGPSNEDEFGSFAFVITSGGSVITIGNFVIFEVSS